jgi:hypothetical protein
MADMLTWAGYENKLRGQFRGTLLLPTNDVTANLLSQQQQQQRLWGVTANQHC